MYTIVNTYPNTSDDNAKDIKTAAARVVYEELIKYLEGKNVSVHFPSVRFLQQ